LPWAKDSPEGELATKYPYVVHAELNAIMNKNSESCRGCRLYCTLSPCNECAKVIIQSGIKKVIFASDKNHKRTYSIASRKLLNLAGVETVHLAPKASCMYLGLRYPEDEPFPEPGSEVAGNGLCQPCTVSQTGAQSGAKSSAEDEVTGNRNAMVSWRERLLASHIAASGVPFVCGAAAVMMMFLARRTCSRAAC